MLKPQPITTVHGVATGPEASNSGMSRPLQSMDKDVLWGSFFEFYCISPNKNSRAKHTYFWGIRNWRTESSIDGI